MTYQLLHVSALEMPSSGSHYSKGKQTNMPIYVLLFLILLNEILKAKIHEIYDHTLEPYDMNLLKTKRNLLYIRNQSVPCSKHFPPRL